MTSWRALVEVTCTSRPTKAQFAALRQRFNGSVSVDLSVSPPVLYVGHRYAAEDSLRRATDSALTLYADGLSDVLGTSTGMAALSVKKDGGDRT